MDLVITSELKAVHKPGLGFWYDYGYVCKGVSIYHFQNKQMVRKLRPARATQVLFRLLLFVVKYRSVISPTFGNNGLPTPRPGSSALALTHES